MNALLISVDGMRPDALPHPNLTDPATTVCNLPGICANAEWEGGSCA